MKTSIRHFQVATAGLDLLHGTRLKLACSLLLAERMDVTLRSWSGDPVDLLVVGGDPSAVAATLQQAHQQGIATLTIARNVNAPSAGRLPHGASVRDINLQLATLLAHCVPAAAITPVAAAATASTRRAAPSLLGAIQSTAVSGLQLMQRGALMVAVDTATRSLALPAGMSLAEIVPLLDEPGWSSTALDADTFQHQYVYRLPQRRSFETLYFFVARHRPQLLAAPAGDVSMQLQHWPDLDHSDAPASWLLPIARLHARPWTSFALAAACRLPHDSVQPLFSAAIASGLAMHQDNAVPTRPRPAGLRDSRFLGWVARRFGLDLQGSRP